MSIVICNQKGGVGKTTTAVNVSAQLALMGKRVLLVDMDPQGAATSGVGIEKEKLERTIYDVLVGEASMSDIVLETKIDGLFVAPSNINLSGAEVELAGVVGREFILKEALDSVGSVYEFVIVDTPPTLGILTINAMVACNRMIVPVQAEYYALEGIATLLRTVDLIRTRLKNNIELKVLLTMYDKRLKLSKEVAGQVRDYFKDKVFKTVIPRNVRLAEAPSYGMPIHLYDSECLGARAYRKLAEEVIELGW